MRNDDNNKPLEILNQELLEENKKLHVEIGMLKSDIDMLESAIEKKDAAIKAFKEWQKKVSERKFQYWAQEYISSLEDREEMQKIKKLMKTYYCEEAFYKEYHRFITNLRDYIIMHNEISDERIKMLLYFNNDSRFIKQFESLEKKIKKFEKLKEYILETFTNKEDEGKEESSETS